jgi:hypothetical protein
VPLYPAPNFFLRRTLKTKSNRKHRTMSLPIYTMEAQSFKTVVTSVICLPVCLLSVMYLLPVILLVFLPTYLSTHLSLVNHWSVIYLSMYLSSNGLSPINCLSSISYLSSIYHLLHYHHHPFLLNCFKYFIVRHFKTGLSPTWPPYLA